MSAARDTGPASPLRPLPAGFPATVASLHRVAELIVAPARKPQNEIALEATAGGFGTPEFEFEGNRHQLRVEGTNLVHRVGADERRAPLASLTAAAEVVTELLPSSGELDDTLLAVDPASAAALAAWYELGAEVLQELVDTAAAEEAATPPILWPEHFDIAIEMGGEAAGRRANYGFSPGDEEHPDPYVYVGPWTAEVNGELWQARGFRGAELGYAELLAAADRRAAAIDFFRTRQRALEAAARP